jgi:hypothetical protein
MQTIFEKVPLKGTGKLSKLFDMILGVINRPVEYHIL